MTLRRFLVLLALFAAARPAAAVDSYDALATARPAPRALAARAAVPGARVTQGESRFGVPTFLWTAPRAAGAAPLALPPGAWRAEAEARRALADHAALYGLAPADLGTLELREVHDTGRGPVIARFAAVADGVPVFREETSVAMTRALAPFAISGYVAPAATLPREGRFQLDAREAAALALTDVASIPADARDFAASAGDGGYTALAWSPAEPRGVVVGDARARRVFFHLPEVLVPAWYVELRAGGAASADSAFVAWVIAATDGRVLWRADLTSADSFSYRVWADPSGTKQPMDGPMGNADTPHPTGSPDGFQPPFVAPSLVSLQNGPISTNDPWLPSGAGVTTGNNADAYADLVAPDGYSDGDLRPTATAPGVFDRVYDTTKSPGISQGQVGAAVTQLFYDVNFFHDWYYDSGFDEKAGNAQASNYGRGGVENDSIKAEAQDNGGRNNANMSTPADGSRPRMQMYVFDGNAGWNVNVNAPAGLAGARSSGVAAFGAQAFQVTADAVLMENAGGLHDGCTAPTNGAALAGKIAMIDRGSCNFTVKVKFAQVAGAVGALVLNNQPGLLTMAGDDATVTIPAMVIQQSDGAAIRGASGLNVTLLRRAATDRDGTLDNEIVAHEWGHYISNRLVHNSSGLNTTMSRGLGEGWGDTHALLFAVRADDAALAANPGWSGAFGLAGYVSGGSGDKDKPNDGFYYGIRRVPYSTDFSKDPLTFQHIADGTPLPTTAPLAYGQDGANNAEVHNAGEVWATMLWECYASLLRDTDRFSFEQARGRWKDILVASYKLTPVNPTLLEARDAVLAAAKGFDERDALLLSQAFARRGAGTRAVAPDRYNVHNRPVVESYLAGGDLALVSASLDDARVSCDVDGILDAGETGNLTLAFRNVGSAALSATTVTLAPGTAGLSVVGPRVVAVPRTQPGDSVTVTVPVALASASAVTKIELSATVNDPSMTEPLVAPLAFRGNADDVAGQSATDDVESDHPAWTATGTFARVADDPFAHHWRAVVDAAHVSSSLVSPALSVPGALQLSFRQRYSFNSATLSSGTTVYLDGGVLEVSTDGGSAWQDVSALGVTVPYTQQVYSGGGNPVGGRRAFAGESSAYPAYQTVALDFGSALAGKTVRFRFLLGSYLYYGLPGWEIDDIAFAGPSNKPFASVVAHRGQCVAAGSIAFDASPAAPAYGDTVTMNATVPGGTGSVTFLDNGAALATAALDGAGKATLRTSALAAGRHVLSAFWPGTASVAPATSAAVTITVGGKAGTTTSSAFLPIVLDVDTGSAHFVSEVALANPGTLPVTARMTYTASMGSGSGTVETVVPAGTQVVLPDALTHLRLGGLEIGSARDDGPQGGTLAIAFQNVSPGAAPGATVRTFALTAEPQPVGAAGLAYGGADSITTSATLFGLRQNATDRSNVAVVNTGAVPVTLRVTAFSGAADGRSAVVADAETLAPGAWKQYTQVLAPPGYANGWVVAERTSADGSFGAYGVINDNKTNDGSYVPPTTGAPSGATLTVPVLVETPAFRSELVLANRGAAAATFALAYRESLTPGSGSGGTVTLTLAPGEQRIVPEAVDFLRRNGATLGAKDAASYAGAVRVTVTGVPAGSVFVGARTASQSPAGGQFGLFTPCVYSGQEASGSATLFGLRADENNRTNVALVNAGGDAAGPVTLSLKAEGVSSGSPGSVTQVTLQPGEWRQVANLLPDAGISSGWVTVTRVSGTAPWIAYGVINDGGSPGQRTGDGAYVPMTR